ncbi:MAG: hypothetical protein ACRDQ1_00605 [Sciscionella sp.]
MARLEFGGLRDAWKGEATDFTPLLAEQLDALGDAIGVDLMAVGKVEVPTAGGRSIDIVAAVTDGPEFVIENQYGRADHDHLTRGLAYAVARNARGLVVVAEQHRDEFRAVAQYLNEMAEHDVERGIGVWLVEGRAVRIAGSAWAPLFTPVVSPNQFTATVEQAKSTEVVARTLAEFLEICEAPEVRSAVEQIAEQWTKLGHHLWFYGYGSILALAARGPSKGGERSVLSLYGDGRVMVPFGAYAGQNTGISVPDLTTAEFRAKADQIFGFTGSSSQPRTSVGWLNTERIEAVLAFASEVARAYQQALGSEGDQLV